MCSVTEFYLKYSLERLLIDGQIALSKRLFSVSY